jgi:hypothetical protein
MAEITPILQKLKNARVALLETAQAVPCDRWREAARPGAWSAGEVIAHLTMVEGRVMQGAEKIASMPAVVVPVWQRFHLPVQLAAWRGFRVKSPVPLDPTLLDEKEAMLERLTGLRKLTLHFLENNRDRDLHPYRFKHPFFGSLDLYDWMRMIAHHELRHTKQIHEIVESFQL